jgi:YD repeat-containing protein
MSARISSGITGAIALAVAAACGGGGSGTGSASGSSGTGGNPAGPGGTSQTCRLFATSFTQVTSGLSLTTTSTCTVNTSTRQATCVHRLSDGTTLNSVSTYNSVSDIVDEVRVIPPLTLVRSAVASQTSPSGVTSPQVTTTYSYDAQGRATSVVSPSNTTTYTQWDSVGRPTLANDVGAGFNNTRLIVHNDGARTRTTTVNNGILTTVETFDANGNLLSQTTSGAGQTQTITYTTLTTDRVCK